MGYGISVTKDGEVCHAGENLPYEGSNVCIGGTDRMSMTVTYNYGGLLREALGGDGVRDLDGCNVKCTVQKLKDAIGKLSGMDDAPWIEKCEKKGEDPSSYWTETPSNVKKALEGMLWMAEKAPDGSMWEVH